mgnify:CR=1 FL=1
MSLSKELHSSFEKKTDSTGNINPKYIDLLDEDKSVAGQKFVCLSFISPEKIIKQRESFMFENFIQQWEFTKTITKYRDFFSFIAYKYNLKLDSVMKDFEEFCISEKENLKKTNIDDEFKTFLDTNEDELEKTFNSLHNFQTSVRGVKIRGSFPSQQEAELRSKMLREADPNHDVYVGQVGLWMPFHPEAYKTGRVEYLEEELNQIMSEKIKNEKAVKEEFDKRVRETKENAINENMKKAEESDNLLTQTINKDGELVNVKDINTTEKTLLSSTEEVTASDIRKELFEGENIITDKNNDHGFSRLPQESKEHLKPESEKDSENEVIEINTKDLKSTKKDSD